MFRIPLRSGTAWFKVANPGQAFEGELLAALSRVASGRVIEPWAVEPVEGWTLLPDGGPTLDWESEDDWLGLITDVALLHRHCQGHVAELAMLPSYEAAAAADRAEHLLAELARLPSQHAQHLNPDQARSCLRSLPRLRDQLAVLDDTGPASTLQPNDAQPGNAVRATARDQPRRLFDLGDAVWSHPWAVLHASGRGIAAGIRLTDPWPQEPATRRLVDAYAEHWPEISSSDRRTVLRAAERLGALHRAESWRRLLAETDTDMLVAPAPRIATWLIQALLDDDAG